MTGIRDQESDGKIREKRSDTRMHESLRSVHRVRVAASMKLNLIPASSGVRSAERGDRSSEAAVGGQGEVEWRTIATPEKGVLPGACD